MAIPKPTKIFVFSAFCVLLLLFYNMPIYTAVCLGVGICQWKQVSGVPRIGDLGRNALFLAFLTPNSLIVCFFCLSGPLVLNTLWHALTIATCSAYIGKKLFPNAHLEAQLEEVLQNESDQASNDPEEDC